VDSGLQIEQGLAGGDDLVTQEAPLAGFQRRLEQLLHPLLGAASPSSSDDPNPP